MQPISELIHIINQKQTIMEQKNEKSVFEVLNAINVNEHTEKKNGLTYLSWAWAWQEVKKHYPDATYTIYENANGMNYHTDGRTCWVKTGVTINGLEHIEYLPVMDFRNASIPTDKVTSFDVNKAIQRSLTKAVARHGLGLYIYAGEDLPDAQNAADDKFGAAILEIASATDTDALKDLYYKYEKDYKNDKRFINAVNQRKAELTKSA